MNHLTRLPALALAALATTSVMAQAPSATTATKPVVQTTCTDYVGMQESFKPKFIYFAVGHGKHGAKAAVIDEIGVEKIKPELDEYCKVHLTKSAYDKVIASSMASEPSHKAHTQKKG